MCASLVAQTVKNLPAMQETRVWYLDWEDPLEKGISAHSSILAWRIPWTEEPSRLQSMGSQRVGHDWVTNIKAWYFNIKAWYFSHIVHMIMAILSLKLDSNLVHSIAAWNDLSLYFLYESMHLCEHILIFSCFLTGALPQKIWIALFSHFRQETGWVWLFMGDLAVQMFDSPSMYLLFLHRPASKEEGILFTVSHLGTRFT